MALARCRDCGKEISTDAAACPNCGAPPPRKSDIQPKSFSGALKVVLISIGIFAVFAMLTNHPTTKGTQPTVTAKLRPATTTATTDGYARVACDTYTRAMRARREGLIDHDHQLAELDSAVRAAVQSDDPAIRAAAGRVQREVRTYQANPGLAAAWVAFGEQCSQRGYQR